MRRGGGERCAPSLEPAGLGGVRSRARLLQCPARLSQRPGSAFPRSVGLRMGLGRGGRQVEGSEERVVCGAERGAAGAGQLGSDSRAERAAALPGAKALRARELSPDKGRSLF